MKQNQYVKIKKLSASDSPLYPSADPKKYAYGDLNEDVSVPIEYEVEGYLLNDVKVGNSVSMDRRKRNGIEINGLFRTSAVQSIDTKKNQFKTFNSVYQIEIAKENRSK